MKLSYLEKLVLMYRNFYTLTSLLICLNALSQEKSIYQNYYLNSFLINPAATGSNYYPVVDFSIREQWMGFNDAPSTYLASGNFRIGNHDFYNPRQFVNKSRFKIKERIGLGASFYSDTEGPVNTSGGLFSYAYHIPIGHKDNLSFGMSFIGSLRTIHNAMLEPNQPVDNYLFSGNEPVFNFNVNIGACYYTENYFAGFSFNKILRDLSMDYYVEDLNPSYYLIGGYKFRQDNNYLSLEPSATLKVLAGSKFSTDLHLKVYLLRFNWLAVSYSTGGTMNYRFGLRLIKQLYLSYNYEQALTEIANYNYGTHEICVGINLGLVSVKGIKNTVSGN